MSKKEAVSPEKKAEEEAKWQRFQE